MGSTAVARKRFFSESAVSATEKNTILNIVYEAPA